MATAPRRLVTNAREAITSTDRLAERDLHTAALMRLGLALLSSDTDRYGVISGLVVTATGSDLRVHISPGLALRLDVADNADASPVSWVEEIDGYSLDLTGLPDGGNPRWVAIHLEQGQADEATVAVTRWNEVTRQREPAVLVKRTRPSPTFVAEAGAVAADPAFPAGVAGTIPLAYVYLAAGAATISNDDIILCRPMLRASADDEPRARAYGGGVTVPSDGLSVELQGAHGRFPGHVLEWSVSTSLDLTAADPTTLTVAAGGFAPSGLPAADAIVHFYAAPVPYPDGYDAELAPREFIPGANAAAACGPWVAPGMRNCIVIPTERAPLVDRPQGPPQAGALVMGDRPFVSAGTVDAPLEEMTYLGAAFFDQSAGDFNAQLFMGGHIRLGRPASKRLTNGGGGVLSMWDSSGGVPGNDDVLLPETARRINTYIHVVDFNAQDASPAFEVNDPLISDWAISVRRFERTPDFDAGVTYSTERDFMNEMSFELDSSGSLTFSNVVLPNASDQIDIYMVGYRDIILDSR